MATTLNLVAVPKGLSPEGALEVSIVVAPRLTDGRRLAQFPDMLTWTESLAESAPRIDLRLGATVAPATLDTTALLPELWSALFNEATPVVPFVFDNASDRLVVSYRTRDALAVVRACYQASIAASPGAIPSAENAQRYLHSLGLLGNPELDGMLAQHRMTRYRRQLETHHAEAMPQSVDETMKDFVLFHRMPQPSERAPDPLPSTAEALSELIDFHRAVTALSSHPSLMRALGLVLDVTVDAAGVNPAGVHGWPIATLSVERFETGRGLQNVALMTPRVLYRLHPPAAGLAPVFATAESAGMGGTIVEGYLGLDERFFHLLDLDVDGALTKLAGLAGMLPRASRTPTADGALAALRSAGLSLAVHDRGNEVVRALRRSAELNAAMTAAPNAPTQPFSANDLVRGYRLDVWSSTTGRWQSLHRRRATYRFGEQGITRLDVEEEGYSQFAAASPAPDPTRPPATSGPPVESDLYVHEALARWTGWSLSAPRPGKPIHRSDSHEPLSDDETSDALVTAFKMRQSFAPVPGSLPKLRFGTRYRMRARVVDIAGNSPAPSETEAGPVSAPNLPVSLPPVRGAEPYFRYEPVPHPVLVLRSIPEDRRPAVDRMVIRSFNSSPYLDTVASPDTEERHIAPPRASVDLAEQHGLIDDSSGRLKGDAGTFADLVARADAALPTEPIGTPPQDVPIERSARLVVDWLPDPLARAAAFRFLPSVAPGRVAYSGADGLVEHAADSTGQAGPVLLVGFGDKWPYLEAFRVAIVDGAVSPNWDSDAKVLTVALPKAEVTEVRLSSALADADLELMGIWAWERSYLEWIALDAVAASPSDLSERLERHAQLSALLARLALEGGQWALTPSIPLHLIHAVQQPIGRPAFKCRIAGSAGFERRGMTLHAGRRAPQATELIAMRALGSPDATLIGGLDAHFASTGYIDFIAAWQDVVDAPETPDGFKLIEAHSTLEPIRLDRTEGEIPAQGQEPRNVAVVVGRDQLAFQPEAWLGSWLKPAAGPIHRFGDTRHRNVTYKASATSRFQGDFPSDQGLVFTRESDPITISVPNSASPPAPRIVQVLPTFGWRRERTGTLTSSIRLGRGLRIYLDGPWYVSGEGELLGIVLWRGGVTPPSKEERRDRFAGLVTEWGLDPVRRSGQLSAMPSTYDLTEATVRMDSVWLDEAGIDVDIAGHPVRFDHDRGLWYSDLTLAAEEAYMPFLRLALVRFQPESIAGAEISAVTPADIIQLTPDRSAVLIADPALPRLYRLVVSGIAPTSSDLAPWRNMMEVGIEERRSDITSDLGWQPVSPFAARVTPTTTATGAPAVLFSGLVEFAVAPSAGRYRLVIKEYETWQIDPPSALLGRIEALGLERMTGTGFAAPKREAAISTPPVAGLVVESQRVESRFVFTSRALERLGAAITGPPTGCRLVYAEFVPVEPAVKIDDPSLSIGEPDVGVPGPPPEEEQPSWPARAAPPPGDFAPRWEDLGEISSESGQGGSSGTVKLAQAMLNVAVPGLPPLTIDGVFGPLTTAAVRAFQAATLFPETGGIDHATWIALAIAAPFPILQSGLGDPPMTGPPIALVQRLFNTDPSQAPLPEDGVYAPATKNRVAAFQSERSLPVTGMVDLETWLEIAKLFDALRPSGAEQVVLEFDRVRLAAGGDAIELVRRTPLDNEAAPTSDSLSESWQNRDGLWLELQDPQGRPLFRYAFGSSLVMGNELPASDDEPMARAPSPPATATLVAVLPVLAAATRLVVFGIIDPNDTGPAAPLLVLEPW